jgi:hypothetical protein
MVLTILAALVGRDALQKLGGVVRDALRSRAQLVAKNALLRQQLLVLHRQVSRPRLTEADRWWMEGGAGRPRGRALRRRGPPYCKSTVLRRKALGDAA